MNRTFGVKLDHLHYPKRKGCYAVILDPIKQQLAVVLTAAGHYFLPGGGIEEGETEEECLRREVLEETGYELNITAYIGTAQRYFITSQNDPLLSEGAFYAAELVDKVMEPLEDDHVLQWVRMEQVKELFHEHQVWAVNRWLEQLQLGENLLSPPDGK